MKLFLGSKL
ncbi:hypothetical protein EYZ11_003262 [Aspergillus tanneri]|uniref:Uncharacterized protein n=1 Tax=Aspergillus tanneri TaxID=1220188 RepID=A0A4S3JP83_9EURO|nr:hypothetical protein EYZ11_003262 [Aspergillus tanneri]